MLIGHAENASPRFVESKVSLRLNSTKKLRVPQSFISKVETGERSLRVYEQFAYAEALGITVRVLVQRLGAVLSSGDK